MKTITKYNSGLLRQLILCTLVVGLITFVSCKKDLSNGLPLIKDVRITSPTAADSTFTRAFPGRLIVIQGVNLDDLKQVYFNNTLAPFNPVYATSTNILITIPATLPLKGTNPTLPNTIRVVTSHGEAVYDFKFLSATPTITTFQFRIPAKVDSTLVIYGTNFYEVQKIVFFRNVSSDSVAITDFKVNSTYNKITLKIPAGCNVDGHITVMCESGNATDTYLAAPLPVFVSYNDDMPTFGDSLIITGKYFFALQKIILPGNVEVLPAAVKISSLADRIAFKMPAITVGGKITVQCETGSTYSDDNFYDLSKVLVNYDTKGSINWGANNTVAVAGTVPPLNSSGKFLRIAGTPGSWYAWFGVGVSDMAPWPTTIPDNTLLSNLVLKMKVFANKPWTKCYFEFHFTTKNGAFLNWQPWSTAAVPVGQWVTMSIPLSSFPGLGTTYADLKSLATAGGVTFYFKNNTADNAILVDLSFDDFRLAYK